MTDTLSQTPDAPRKTTSLHTQDARTKKRNAAEARFKFYGMTAIAIGLFFLVVLAVSIVRSGLPAFTQAVVNVEFTLTKEQFDDGYRKEKKKEGGQTLMLPSPSLRSVS